MQVGNAHMWIVIAFYQKHFKLRKEVELHQLSATAADEMETFIS